MNKILFIAYYFPPHGGSGTQRTYRFVKYLNDYNFEPIIISSNVSKFEKKDHSLINDLDKCKYKVFYIKYNKIIDIYYKLKKIYLHKFISFIDKFLLFPDKQIFWVKKVKKEINKNKNLKHFIKECKIVYATYGPASNLFLGYFIAKKYKKKLIIDFRDEWSNNPFFIKLWDKFKKPFIKYYESKIIKKADKVICLNYKMRQNFIRKYEKYKNKFEIIPNGYDLEHFNSKNLKNKLSKKDKTDNTFKIYYSGSLYGKQKLTIFFVAINNLFKKFPEFKKIIKIIIIGSYNKNLLQSEILKFNLKNNVILKEYLEHNLLLNYLKEADLLLLVIGKYKGAEVVYTGKLFEYIVLKRPILAIVPENGVAAEVIKRTKTGYVTGNVNPEKIEKTLLTILNKWKNGNPLIYPDIKGINKYNASELTKKLASVFNSTLD